MSTSTFVCFLHQYDTMRRGKTTSSSRMKSNRLHQIYTMSLWVTEYFGLHPASLHCAARGESAVVGIWIYMEMGTISDFAG